MIYVYTYIYIHIDHFLWQTSQDNRTYLGINTIDRQYHVVKAGFMDLPFCRVPEPFCSEIAEITTIWSRATPPREWQGGWWKKPWRSWVCGCKNGKPQGCHQEKMETLAIFKIWWNAPVGLPCLVADSTSSDGRFRVCPRSPGWIGQLFFVASCISLWSVYRSIVHG